MTDQLHLSIWLERHAQMSRLRHFGALLRLVPFSQREQPQSDVTIQAIDLTEPPLLERALNGPIDIAEIEPIFDDYRGDDLAYEVESWWDLWQYDGDWVLRPAAIAVACFGPEFDNGTEEAAKGQEDLRIDFGVDSHYLPDPTIPGSAKMSESNIKGLLRLVHQIESTLPVRERRLETESGENFAQRLQEMLTVVSQRPS